jgi:hypothetical protein
LALLAVLFGAGRAALLTLALAGLLPWLATMLLLSAVLLAALHLLIATLLLVPLTLAFTRFVLLLVCHCHVSCKK